MPWFRFDHDFDFKPRPGVTVAYRAGMHVLVTRVCALRAEALGRGKRERKPKTARVQDLGEGSDGDE